MRSFLPTVDWERRSSGGPRPVAERWRAGTTPVSDNQLGSIVTAGQESATVALSSQAGQQLKTFTEMLP
jgi:hypothetical protein